MSSDSSSSEESSLERPSSPIVAYESPPPSPSTEGSSPIHHPDSSPIQPGIPSPARHSVSSSSGSPPPKRTCFEVNSDPLTAAHANVQNASATNDCQESTEESAANNDQQGSPARNNRTTSDFNSKEIGDNEISGIESESSSVIESEPGESDSSRSDQANYDEEIINSDGDRNRGDGSESCNTSRSDVDSSPGSSGNESDSESDSFHFGDLKVYEGCDLSVDEGVLILFDLFMDHKLEKSALKSVLKAVMAFLPKVNSMPGTKHTLFKYVQNQCPPVPPKVHYYCKTCHYYLGEKEKKCAVCKTEMCNKFYQLPILNQIKNLFENHNLEEIIQKYTDERKEREQPGTYHDVCDGSEFKRVQLPGECNLTLLGHTDGVSISGSSNVSLWPLEFVILELPPKLRFKFVLVAGVWVDDCKPNMNCYLKPVVNELQYLGSVGLTWTNPKTQAKETSLVTAPGFCADAPVRAQLQNILSHGGRYCCNSCEQKMVRLPAEPVIPGRKRKPRKRVYAPQEVPSKLRTSGRMAAQGKISRERHALTGKLVPEKGVRGKSIVSMIPFCDRSTVVYPEYMHSILGITKQFMSLWFEKTGVPCTFKEERDAINALLLNIRVPDFITRVPRSTDIYNSWKAHECRAFLLFFSLIILSKFMNAKYLQHWMLFVTALFLLLQETITEVDISRAEVMLKIFHCDFSTLYSTEDFTYNLHNVYHWGLTCRRYGPLWSNSAFNFESYNGILQQRIHGSKNQGIELVETIQLFQSVEVLRANVEDRSNRKKQQQPQQDQVALRSKMKKKMKFTVGQKRLLDEEQLSPKDFFFRAAIGREVYTCNKYERQIKKNNYTISYRDSLGDRSFGEISCFFDCFDNNQLMAFVDCLAVEHDRIFVHDSGFVVPHIIPIKNTTDVQLIPITDILCKVIRVDDFVCLRPNKYETVL